MVKELKSLDGKIGKSNWKIWWPIYGIFPYLGNIIKNRNEIGNLDLFDLGADMAGHALYQSTTSLISTLLITGFYKALEIDKYLEILFPQF